MKNPSCVVKNSCLVLPVLGIGLFFSGCETGGDHYQRDSGGYNREMHMEEHFDHGATLETQPTEQFAELPASFTQDPDEAFAQFREPPDFTKIDIVAAPMMSARQAD